MRALALDLDILASVCRRQAVSLLIVFGSVVRGLRRPDSDLDLAVWMTTANMTPQALVSLEVALRPIFPGECLDIVLLNRASPLLQFQVAQYGTVLFEAAPGTFHAFQVLASKRHADIQYEAIDHTIVHSAIADTIAQYTEYCRHITIFLDRHNLPPTA
jgi:predicted nucleotidyltransferase